MTIKSPLWLENLTYSATDMRRLISQAFALPGCFESGDLAVVQHGAGNMSVDVAVGSAAIAGTAVAGQGSYLFTSDAIVNVPIDTAPGAGQSRYDLIVAKIEDADADGGANNDGIIEVIKGTAASTGTQVAPSAPASSLKLGRVLVGPSVVTILTANITDFRTFAHSADHAIGDWKMVSSSTLPGPGWEWADGAAVSRTGAYAAAFANMGTSWGAGDGLTTFNKPDMRNFFPVGAGSTYGVAGTGGEATHALTTAELAVHAHTVTDPQHTHPPQGPASGFVLYDSPSTDYPATSATTGYDPAHPIIVGSTPPMDATGAAATGLTVNNAGSGTAHNNLPPYKGVRFAVLMR